MCLFYRATHTVAPNHSEHQRKIVANIYVFYIYTQGFLH